MNRYKLTIWQKQTLAHAKALVPGKPPEPWLHCYTVSAAGIFAGGWTKDENFIMLSPDGYSEHDPLTGDCLIFDRDVDAMYDNLDAHERYFSIPSQSEKVDIFGIKSRDGIHVIDDWGLSVIYPRWPNATVILRKGSSDNWDNVYALDTGVCDPGNWIKCGFAPSGKLFVILGHAGAEFFSRNAS